MKNEPFYRVFVNPGTESEITFLSPDTFRDAVDKELVQRGDQIKVEMYADKTREGLQDVASFTLGDTGMWPDDPQREEDAPD